MTAPAGGRPGVPAFLSGRASRPHRLRRRYVLPVVLGVLELLVVAAWLRWAAAMGMAATRPPSAGALVVLGVVAAVALAATRDRGWAPLVVVLGAVLSALVLSGVTAAPAGVSWGSALLADLGPREGRPTGVHYVLAAVLVAWWRATRHAQRPVTSGHVRSSVVWVILGLSLLAVATRLTYDVALGGFVLAAAVLSLAAMALARSDDAALDSGQASGMGAAWAVLVPASILLVLALAAVLSAVVSLDLARQVLAAVRPLPNVLLRLVVLAVLSAAELLARVFGPVWSALRAALANKSAIPLRNVDTPPPMPLAEGGHAILAPWVVDAIRVGLAVALILLVALWLARSFRRYTTVAEEEGVERSMELSRGRIVGDAASLVRGLVAGLRRRVRIGAGDLDGVRATYARFLALMARRGVPRRVATTPWEYVPVAASALPGVAGPVADLTAAYVAARYGGETVDAAGAARLNAAWAAILDYAERTEET